MKKKTLIISIPIIIILVIIAYFALIFLNPGFSPITDNNLPVDNNTPNNVIDENVESLKENPYDLTYREKIPELRETLKIIIKHKDYEKFLSLEENFFPKKISSIPLKPSNVDIIVKELEKEERYEILSKKIILLEENNKLNSNTKIKFLEDDNAKYSLAVIIDTKINKALELTPIKVSE
jgi:hypothetical protein